MKSLESDQIQRLKQHLGAFLTLAKKLTKLSSGNFDAEEVNHLQEQQTEYLTELVDLEKSLSKSYADGWGKAFPKALLEVKELKQAINKASQEFIQNLKVRKELIQIDIQEINKTKSALSAVKELYGTGNQQSRRQKVNALS